MPPVQAVLPKFPNLEKVDPLAQPFRAFGFLYNPVDYKWYHADKNVPIQARYGTISSGPIRAWAKEICGLFQGDFDENAATLFNWCTRARNAWGMYILNAEVEKWSANH